MQMEWCNQFDSSIRIPQKRGGEREGDGGGGHEERLFDLLLCCYVGFKPSFPHPVYPALLLKCEGGKKTSTGHLFFFFLSKSIEKEERS